jgi:hypothetical protein
MAKGLKYQCGSCGARCRLDGSCGTETCSNYRKSLRGAWIAKAKDSWKKKLSPAKTPARKVRHRRKVKGPPSPPGSCGGPLCQLPVGQPAEPPCGPLPSAPLSLDVAGVDAEHPKDSGLIQNMLVPELAPPSKKKQSFSLAPSKEHLVRESIREVFPLLMSEIGEPRALQVMSSVASFLRYCPAEWRSPVSQSKELSASVRVWQAAVLRCAWEFVQTPSDPSRFQNKALRAIFDFPANTAVQHAELTLLGWFHR